MEVLSWLGALGSLAPVAVASLIFGALYLVVNAIGIRSLTLQVLIATAIGVAGFALLGWCRYSFRCPRCKELFFVKNWSLPPTLGDGKECVHCHLARNSLEEPSEGDHL